MVQLRLPNMHTDNADKTQTASFISVIVGKHFFELAERQVKEPGFGGQ